jgi:signal transduction histidine kinase
MGPGLVSTVISVMSSAFFFMPPYFSLAVGLQDGARLAVFTLVVVVTASLSSARRAAEEKQRRAITALHEALDEVTRLSEDLEQRVAVRTSDLDRSNQALKAEIIKSRDLSRRLVQARETERRRLARELHDQIGQSLTGLKFTLEATSRDSGPANGKPEALELVESLMSQVREISLDLRPAVLDDLGLIPALLWHFDRYQSQTGIRVMFTQTGMEERLTPEIETAAFRIVQEALTNIARHAGVTEARVWIRKDPEELSVIVEDEGCGFSQPSSQAFRSPGLSSMRERATLVGGQFSLVTAPSSGTRISAVLPLQPVVRHQV